MIDPAQAQPTGHLPPNHVRWGRRLLAAAALAATAAGCTRHHYRERADKDVAGVLTQKNVFPDWKIENWHVYPDPRARHASPQNPDHPPFPPEDPAAWLLSPNPQRPHKKYGSGRFEGTEYLKLIDQWDAQNRAEDDAEAAKDKTLPPPTLPGTGEPKDGPKAAADPDRPLTQTPTAVPQGGAGTGYQQALRTDEKPFRLRLDQAVELALFNSREFQDRREDLYLVALPVTTERFGFAAQALAAENIVREVLGRERAGGPANRWNFGTDVAVNRLFPTGATLLVRLANQIVLDMTSGRPDVSVSNLSLSFVQPLLRGGGFAVTLEALTQSERTLLYAIRSYAHFRRVFYVAIAGQGDYTNNPYGLQGLAPNLGRGVGANLTAPVAGYNPIVLRAANLANERRNIAALEQFGRLYQNLKEGGVVSDLQAVRVELQLLQSQARLLDSNRQYLDQLDSFKLQLGVPTNLPVELDDTPLRPIRKQLQRFDELYLQLEEFQNQAGRFDQNATTPQIRERWRRLLTESSLARGTPFAREYPKVAADLAALPQETLDRRVADLLAQRQKLLDRRAERQLTGQPETDAEAAELAAIEAAIDLARLEQAFRRYDARPWLKFPPERRPAEQALAYRGIADAGLLVALQARNQRLDTIRDSWPEVPRAEVDGADVLRVPLDDGFTRVAQAALVNRLDLMNVRAQVVDSYRQIAVRANALLGTFDIRYDLNSSTPASDNVPFAFAGSRTRHAVSLNIEPPFVRRVERNNYRATLISYQRDRRRLMAFEDNILFDVRQDLRQLRALAETYKVQQRSVELAYAQVDNARATLLAPPDPTQRDASGTAAALTEQLLNAQNQLLTAQNALYTAWVNYLNTRMTLYLDLELLPLDARGLWTDEPPCATPQPGPGPRPADGPQPERPVAAPVK